MILNLSPLSAVYGFGSSEQAGLREVVVAVVVVVVGVVSVVVTVVMVLVSGVAVVVILVSVVVESEVTGTIVELCDEDGEAGLLALLDGELEALEGGLLLSANELVDGETWRLDRPVLLLAGGLAEDETTVVVLVVKSESSDEDMILLVLAGMVDVDVKLGVEVEGTVIVVGELVLAGMGATNVGFGALVCCTRSIQALPAIAPIITGMQSREGIVSNPAYSSPPQS